METQRGARARLLEAGGQVFSELGFDAATGKEIAERAGVNAAAVNYHFGSLEGLYAAVLTEARDRLVGSHAILEVVNGPAGPEEKMKALIRLVVRAAVTSGAAGWALRILGREVTAPSPTGLRLLISTVGPRAQMLRAMVSQLANLPEDHPSAAMACISIVSPLQLLLIADKKVICGLHPSLDISPTNEEALAEHFFSFAMAGLAALRARAPGGSSRPG